MDRFRAKWTADIHEEWINALMRTTPDRDRIRLQRTRDLMNSHARDCLVTNYHHLIESLDLPDPDDRHVLAAAIVGRCDVIVTQNIKDFPLSTLSRHSIDVQHPDEFLCDQIELDSGLFCQAMQTVRNRLKSPPYTARQHLEILSRCGLVGMVSELESFVSVI